MAISPRPFISSHASWELRLVYMTRLALKTAATGAATTVGYLHQLVHSAVSPSTYRAYSLKSVAEAIQGPKGHKSNGGTGFS